MDDLTGQWLGDYKLIGLIATGGFGSVYSGVHGPSGALVAIKVLTLLSFEEKTRQQQFAKFHQEVDTLKSLHHPHIIPLLGSGESTYGPYLVMAHVEKTVGDRYWLNPQVLPNS